MNLIGWHLPLESCKTLDELRAHWRILFQEYPISSGEENAYEDAVLSFLGRSTLTPALKLAAVLTGVNGFDFDVRIALGALAEPLEESTVPWPLSVEDVAAPTGPAIPVSTADPWLAGFVAGRLQGLRDTLRHDGIGIDDWRAVFWNKFLQMSCRWADRDGVELALRHGADPRSDACAAIAVLSEGVHAYGLRTPYYFTGTSRNADHMAILTLLLDAGVQISDIEVIALRSAAAVNNTDMLAFLIAQGADLHADDDAALTAGATTMAVDAVEWLLAQGADVHAGGDAALLAAVGSLDETMVELLLAAGADIHAGDELPLRTALSACPDDLYDSDTDFIHQRAGMIAVLLRRGASPDAMEVAKALRQAPDARELIQALLADADLSPQEAQALDRLATAAFGDTDAT
ncbi:ankyrin repeat domain-containing protein [Noviherbaspirillum pedocola]|uniref:Ankyrin repeat domain-containing protein n=1 Tax=Noviherbaspirillum pedocola TaxID=2801341 RepID=A0A934SU52_9BURK|nr:ankyrin repeat domain-containing protein [Noviherbaspirillum pedocola]MBK4735231.1 hypothetical protein [Noviherbaspirillum pedocola]